MAENPVVPLNLMAGCVAVVGYAGLGGLLVADQGLHRPAQLVASRPARETMNTANKKLAIEG